VQRVGDLDGPTYERWVGGYDVLTGAANGRLRDDAGLGRASTTLRSSTQPDDQVMPRSGSWYVAPAALWRDDPWRNSPSLTVGRSTSPTKLCQSITGSTPTLDDNGN
jgi:hypothetical protein